MIGASRFVLLAALSPWAAACRETPRAKAAQVHEIETTRKAELARRLALADSNPAKPVPVAEWIMPPELREISGLALTSRVTVLTHDDNVGRVYEIDPKTGILLKGFSLAGGVRGDFEAITIAGSDIYLLRSNGKIYKFKEGPDASQVPYSVYDTGLGKDCEFESMAFEADSARLLLVCKKFLQKQAPKELLIYRVPLPLGDRSAITAMQVAIKDVVGSNKWKNFHPSDINIDPITRNYVIVASREKGLIVVTPDGEVVRSEPLPGDHRQAEGVAITPDSLLLVSDEANVKPPAITLYRWRR
ncbi:MAG TPA: SdiA-regulated domain-containing protein [Gemmatimonadaceae bacterium]|nr:SdiA-regulated domain-containing protein [Gemmatimonadaceae bacterium]